jgi:hypothetical protein
MSHVLDIQCTVSRPDGTEFYYEAHRWTGIDDDGLKMLTDELTSFERKVKSERGRNDDSADLSGVFSCSIDGAASSFSVSGISYKSLVKLQREWHHAGDRVIKEGERRAKSKK